jgi:hypothetical protein
MKRDGLDPVLSSLSSWTRSFWTIIIWNLKLVLQNYLILMRTVIRSEALKYFERFAVLNSVNIRQESKALSPDNEVIQGVRSYYAVAVTQCLLCNVRWGKTVRVWWRSTPTAPCVSWAKYYAAGNKVNLVSSINFAVRGTAHVFRITACTGPCSRTSRFSKCPRRTNC